MSRSDGTPQRTSAAPSPWSRGPRAVRRRLADRHPPGRLRPRRRLLRLAQLDRQRLGRRRVHINVRCFSPDGVPADDFFTLAYVGTANLLGSDFTSVAYAWGDEPLPPT